MPVPVPRWLPLSLIAIAAFWLRIDELDRRPMHADEANQAVKTGELLESGRYAFDPHDHHGPTLYYAALPIAWTRGEHSLATLTETTVRLVPALAGTLGVILLGLIARPLGRRTAVVAAAFMAVSPPAVYYSRYFVQETLLVTFTLGAFWCAQRWCWRRQLGWAVGAGVFVGLMQATKASAPFFLLAAAVTALVIRLTTTNNPSGRRDPDAQLIPSRSYSGSTTAVAVALASALFVAALFYSSFGTHLAGLSDAVAVYGPAARRATGDSGHEKPWWYYLRLFGWHREGGLLWQQIGFSALALTGFASVWWRQSKFLRASAVYSLLIVVALSLTPYKTPWHAVHLVPGFALLAAASLTLLPRFWLRVAAAGIVLVMQLNQTRLVAFTRSADARNPYAYVHSSPDVLKVRSLADAAMASAPSGVVRVIAEEYWPLPWYLRGLPHVGYWSTPPEDCDGSLVITSSDLAETVRGRLHGDYRESFLGLRPGVLLVVFTPRP